MAKLSMQTHIDMQPDALWDVIGKFSAMPDWHPLVQSSKLEDGGHLRRIQIVGGGEVVERLELIDPADRMYRYSVVSGPMPVANYTATLRIRNAPDGKGCTVEWSSEFEPKGMPENDAMKAISDVYKAGFDNLKKMFGGH